MQARVSPGRLGCEPQWLWLTPTRGVWGGSALPGSDARGLAGFTPLHYASSRGHEAVVWLLLRAGFDASAQAVDKSTPLHAAAGGGHLSVLRLLVAFGARVNGQDEFGETPLHAAAKQGDVHAVSCLLAAGASALVVDRIGDSPAEVADKPAVLQALRAAERRQRDAVKGVVHTSVQGRQAGSAALPQWALLLQYCDDETATAVRCASGTMAWLAALAQPLRRQDRLSSKASPDHTSAAGIAAGPAKAAGRAGKARPRRDRTPAAAAANIVDPALASFHSLLKRSAPR